MQRNHRDRPGVHLTAEERRRFAEIAFQLRYELDGLTFPGLAGDLHRPEGRRGPSARLARAAGRATRVLVRLSRWIATPLVLAAIGVAAVAGAAATAGDLRLAFITAGSFTLAWSTTMAALQLARHCHARRVRARIHQHQTSP